ncbi:MAG: DUF1592 domain-containing protein [Verrucomicrobia bacterium]|nr:DUF1592 domain-containing protein [Verrucomicrobiota bacterium]MBI3869341.1 DUF1592 domain-containing protein [Verrucomicrobiota bacterium]
MVLSFNLLARRAAPAVASWGVVASFCFLGLSALAKSPAKTGTPSFEKQILPLIQNYCFDCHGDGMSKGDLALDSYTNTAAVLGNRKVWEHVLQNLKASQMPPARKKSQPTAQERTLMVKWVEDTLFPVDCDHPDPGRVTVRRLNRNEYNRTLRDLLGIDFQPADDFPQDDVGYGFDNIGDVLSMPPVLLERYIAAAEQALNEAIVTEAIVNKRVWRFDPTNLEATAPLEERSAGWIALVREGDVHARVRLPVAGDYLLRARAAGEQAGPEPVKMAMAVNDQTLKTVEVPERRRDAKIHEVRFQGQKGPQKVSVSYLNNYVNPKEKDPKKRDRNMLLEWLEVEGPLSPVAQPLSDTHRRIFFKQPGGRNARAVAEEIVERFASRAWRRPVEKAELKRLMTLFDLAQGQKDTFEKSVKVALQTVLVSPRFLFRGEAQPDPDNPKSVHPIDEYSLGSRLSYFLWGSMPDDRLFQLAGARQLRRNLESEVRRMLMDSKSESLVTSFVGQWLQTRNLELASPDREKFKNFTEELRSDFASETRLFVTSLIQEDRSVLELIDANYSFLNERLAKFYGLEGVSGSDFRKVLFQDRRRGGVLTQGSILTITSNPTRTSPVKRGKWVLETLLGAPPPPPPPNVPELKVDKNHPLTGTLRQKMEQHRANPMCASCHTRMDAIGFAFENYDAIGAWRSKDGEFPIDVSGELGGGVRFNGPAELRQLLLKDNRAEFLRCMTEKMMTYALGRGVEPYDRCAVQQVLDQLPSNGYRFSALVSAIVRSAPFQLRRGE